MIGGELVREARKRAGLTQRQLADRAATTQSAIARLESGRTRPALQDVQRMLKLCGFALIVEIAPYDDSDIIQAEALLRRDAEQRVAAHQSGLRSVARLRASFAAGQHE